MNYEEFIDALIKKGADSKLFDMPAVQERLIRAHLGKMSYSLDDITINSDGTFNFGNCIMQKGIIEREEDVPIGTEIRTTNPVDGENYEHTVYEKQKVPKEVLTIVEYFEKEYDVPILFGDILYAGDDAGRTYKAPAAQLAIINDDGIELEMQRIDDDSYISTRLQQKTLDYKFFEEHPDWINCKLTREKGKIIEEKKQRTVYPGEKSSVRKFEFYDDGGWKLDLSGRASIGITRGDAPVKTMKQFEDNSQKLLEKYPHLQASIKKRETELMDVLDSRTLDLISENLRLESQNEKLQKMLEKALTFAQIVRNSKVGKIFFEKKAKEIIGEQDKNAKQLTERD